MGRWTYSPMGVIRVSHYRKLPMQTPATPSTASHRAIQLLSDLIAMMQPPAAADAPSGACAASLQAAKNCSTQAGDDFSEPSHRYPSEIELALSDLEDTLASMGLQQSRTQDLVHPVLDPSSPYGFGEIAPPPAPTKQSSSPLCSRILSITQTAREIANRMEAVNEGIRL